MCRTRVAWGILGVLGFRDLLGFEAFRETPITTFVQPREGRIQRSIFRASTGSILSPHACIMIVTNSIDNKMIIVVATIKIIVTVIAKVIGIEMEITIGKS